MSWHALFSTLRRSPLMPLLIVGQIVIACAILCNTLFLAWQQLQPMLASPGIDGQNLLLADRISGDHSAWTDAEVNQTLAEIRALPGVIAASAGYGLPMTSGLSITWDLRYGHGRTINADGYFGRDLVKTLGIHLLAGRDFQPGDYRPMSIAFNTAPPDDAAPSGNTVKTPPAPTITPALIPIGLARQLCGGLACLGKVLRTGGDGDGEQVIGITSPLLRYQLVLAQGDAVQNAILLPRYVSKPQLFSMAIRVEPGRQAALLPAVQKILQHRLGPRLGADAEPIRVRSYAEARHASFSDNRSALYMLGGITLAVVLVTVMGVLGLSGFQVQRRQRQIGIYRALGARRRQIMSSFLGENLLLVGAASMLGMGLAWIINQLLMQHYELARLPPSWLPVGAVTAIMLGQLAVLGPARSAAGIAPAEAIRSQ
ncbi:ABC transporter permease [Frateuria aurantia]|uniref:ABC-type antimicrobial peptide transport system, permease component n=1 Tax=Frateuria aurantia (strain ATCC 33424 / DSM 6220 / KCTC 2777 / LMG 1558 / NBRC 3245 / NCIMB 13370) TaxID=767434 RepID=H8KYN8_FRAAD|nr:FtsX-like permease family protein [Frateuria aurantia]AFC85167.1 ABC-type antimicrobial peptide transport system, permease component [Frateuria aurantia DSM 6220]